MLGQCVPALQVIVTSPPNKADLGGPSARQAIFTASVLRLDGGAASALPTSLQVILTGTGGGTSSATRLVDGGFATSFEFPLVEEQYVLDLGWPGGPRGISSFNVDFLAPQQSYGQPPLPAGGYKRDMEAPLLVRSHEPMAGLAATLRGTGTAAVLLSAAPPSTCAAAGLTPDANDVCVHVDLAAPEFNSASGTMTLTTTASDAWGNQSTATGSFAVDRLRWVVTPPGLTQFPSANVAPALDSDGNLYVGINSGALASGRVVSLAPDGGVRWSVALGTVQSVAVGPRSVSGRSGDLVYVAQNQLLSGTSLTGSVRALNASNGSGTGLSAELSGVSLPTWSAIGLYDAGVITGGIVNVGALMVQSLGPSADLNGELGVLCAYTPTGIGACSAQRADYMQAEPGTGSAPWSPTNLVVSGARVWFQVLDGFFANVAMVDVPSSGVPQFFGSSGGFSGAPTGLALTASNVLNVAAGAQNGASLRLYTRPNAGTGASESGGGPSAAPPVIPAGSTTAAFLGGGSGALGLRAAPFTDVAGGGFAPTVGSTLPGSAVSTTSPVLGDQGLLYVVTSGGALHVYDAAAGLSSVSPRWSLSPFGSSAVVHAHPTLDCNRLRGSTRPGTLYVVAQSGAVAAVIVDSRRLEPSSPWPRWQRTAGNAGNTAFPLNPGCP